MIRKFSLALILLTCTLALIVPTGCSSVFAQGTYQRVGRWRLDSLGEAQQAVIRTAIASHKDAASRSQALWNAAEQFEATGNFEAALVAYEEARLTAARPIDVVAERIRRCRARLAVDHRWADEDLRRAAGAMKQSRGLGLFREVAKTVHNNFVDETPYRDILLAGMDNLTAAMASDTFGGQFEFDASKREAFTSALDRLRKDLAAKNGLNSFTARHYVRRACEENRKTVALPDGVVISEFIFGAVEHMDAYSAYLTHAMYSMLIDDLDGHLVGLGIEVRRDAGRLQIVTVFDGGPASKAGMRDGDVILAVDGKKISDAGMNRVVKLLRGTRGSHVKVTLERGGENFTLDIVRDRFDIPSVRGVLRIGSRRDIGYLHIVTFQKNTGTDVARALDSLQSDGPMAGLVIDLRNNPGGLLNAAVDVCSLLLPEGKVVSTKGRGFGQSRSYRVSHWRFERHDMPLVVLVDGTSASASEIVAAALKDHRRATLVGSRTFGKGIVQSVLPVELGQSAVYLTTARFYSPEGTCFHAVGIDPDVRVAGNKDRARNSGANPQTDPVLNRALSVLADKANDKVAVRAAPVPVTVTTR
jgi:carboxyl-terminal processing protease